MLLSMIPEMWEFASDVERMIRYFDNIYIDGTDDDTCKTLFLNDRRRYFWVRACQTEAAAGPPLVGYLCI